MPTKLSFALLAALALTACSSGPTEFASARHCRPVPLKSAILSCDGPAPQAAGHAGTASATRG